MFQQELMILIFQIRLQLAGRSSFYTKVGDWLGWVSLAGFVFFMVFQSVVESKAKKAAKK
jgi:hypothetical protein